MPEISWEKVSRRLLKNWRDVVSSLKRRWAAWSKGRR